MEKDTKQQIEPRAQVVEEGETPEGVFGEKEMRSRMYSGAYFPGPTPSHIFHVPEHIRREYKD
ncbi:MAG: hypothetical protein QG580_24 [Patescibacteria group bacterium]|jgi:hypothetical protein|nr:hypothetical protein [Patescibacteria group bacterium]